MILALSPVASAKDYMIEVLFFDNNNASQASESHDYMAPKPMRSAADTWVLEPSMLLEEADKLQASSEYQLHHHLSWGQEALPYEKSAAYTVIERDVKGYIKVYADRLLFANIDIDYKGFRMQEKRRLKLNEKHFFDHPKFGVLMQVSRLPATTEGDEEEILEENAVELESSR